MSRGLILLLLSPLTLAVQPRDFRVPPVDFTQLSSAVDNAHNFKLLTNLQENGIIALQNVPNYSVLRQEYLRTAVSCAVQAQKQGAEFLLHRRLRDGTRRYTVSLESGHGLSKALAKRQNLLEICPEFVEIHAAFSAVVELAVANVGTALDATQMFHVVAEQGAVAMTARKLLEDSVHLDHFHAYEAAQGLEQLKDDREIDVTDMSLELHTDNGLMIAMSAPEYFEESNNGELQRKDTKSEDAGLFIQTTSGEIVRPVVNPDELILMLGSGIDDWIRTTPPLRSVLHGLRYPRSVSLIDGDKQGTKLLRSWFGKMILLEAHQMMDNTGLTFGQYANRTTRYLVQEEVEDRQAFGAVACPPQRHLAASDNSCSLKTCSLKNTASASSLEFSCQVTCNHDSSTDAKLCEQYCACTASSHSATSCWMMCVENISPCPSGKQVCNTASTKDKLAMTCAGGTGSPSTPSSPTASTSTSNNSRLSTTSTVVALSAPTSNIIFPAAATDPPVNSSPPVTATTAPITATTAIATSTSDATNSNPVLPATDAGTAAMATKAGDNPAAALNTMGSPGSTDALVTKAGDDTTAALNTTGLDALVTKANDNTTAALNTTGSSASADKISLTPPTASAPSSSVSSSSSAASVISAAIFVNGIASLVAAFLCIN